MGPADDLRGRRPRPARDRLSRCPGAGPAHPVWFKNDPRVANVKVAGGVFDRTVMEGVVATAKMVEEQIKTLPAEEQEAALAEVAASVQAGMPPRENPRINTSLDSVYASGPLGRAHCVIHGNCNYKQTGLLQAYRRVLAAAAAAAAGRLRVRLPGLRASGTARRAAQLRAGAGAGPHRARLTTAIVSQAIGGRDDAADRLPRQGCLARASAPCLTMGDRTLSLRRGAGVVLAGRPGRCARSGVAAGRQGGDPVGQRSGRVLLRVRDRPGRCGLVPDQPAQRGRREPRPARPLRLHLPDLPGVPSSRWCDQILPDLPKLTTVVCLDAAEHGRRDLVRRVARRQCRPNHGRIGTDRSRSRRDLAMIVGTGGTTGRPKGVMLTGRNLETMSRADADELSVRRPAGVPGAGAADPRGRRPVLSGAWRSAARSSSCRRRTSTEFLALVERHRVTHTFLPPTLIYMLLAARPGPPRTCRRCSASGTARRRCRPTRLEEALERIGPVMAQLFGQTEAPMMISTMAAGRTISTPTARSHASGSRRPDGRRRW